MEGQKLTLTLAAITTQIQRKSTKGALALEEGEGLSPHYLQANTHGNGLSMFGHIDLRPQTSSDVSDGGPCSRAMPLLLVTWFVRLGI